jgi:hypothetical protein
MMLHIAPIIDSHRKYTMRKITIMVAVLASLLILLLYVLYRGSR